MLAARRGVAGCLSGPTQSPCSSRRLLPLRDRRAARELHISSSASAAAGAAEPSTKPVEYCVIVDEQNRVVGHEPRDVTVRNRLLGRGSYVLVSNGAGELLVSKRSSRKDVYPGHWDVVISGVVCRGEEYEDTAARELAEEIGVSEEAARAGLRRLVVFPYEDSSCHVWGCAFAYRHEGGPLRLQEEEVDWAGFKSWEEVQRMLAQERFTPVGRHILELVTRAGLWSQQ
ncbi:hypothetical protein HYH03_003302 [Edaphochlamys debaryana]|uniref:Nudix hydrolase domain-containing protein n=1 Tax=Edaphochlamys debaryana TaxID=47281 RepID=A0A836C2Z2_9CHLO|nr:hypothetical protein HYH03_003302 [Edaphochlamys debaryana]|eukprot:KAG2498551.1 hypothetical protein HYH03_003302 [Edaphochlamys debaryana]